MSSPKKMKTFSFTVVLSGTDVTDEMANALYEAGCSDATLGVSCGRAYVDFDREAPSLSNAIESALRQIREVGLSPIGIEPGDLVTQSEMAERAEVTRQSISNYVLEKRGGGAFPPPVFRVTTSSPLWRWTEVSRWLAEHEVIDETVVETAETLARFDGEIKVHASQASS